MLPTCQLGILHKSDFIRTYLINTRMHGDWLVNREQPEILGKPYLYLAIIQHPLQPGTERWPYALIYEHTARCSLNASLTVSRDCVGTCI